MCSLVKDQESICLRPDSPCSCECSQSCPLGDWIQPHLAWSKTWGKAWQLSADGSQRFKNLGFRRHFLFHSCAEAFGLGSRHLKCRRVSFSLAHQLTVIWVESWQSLIFGGQICHLPRQMEHLQNKVREPALFINAKKWSKSSAKCRDFSIKVVLWNQNRKN